VELRFATQSLSIVLLTLLGACADEPAKTLPPPDATTALLARAAEKASSALKQLAEIEAGLHPTAPLPPLPLDTLPKELTAPVTLSWVGPLGPVVQVLASKAGYQFLETGPKTAQPVLVRIDAIERPLIEILRDIGLQAAARVTIDANVPQRQVEVRYAPQ
jgi:hypothetical protein